MLSKYARRSRLSAIRMFSSNNKFSVPDEYRILKGNSQIVRRLDAYLRLVRFDKQIGTNLLLIPCYWGICIASPAGALPSLYTMGLFTVGALCARSAG